MLPFGECSYGEKCKFYHPKIGRNSMQNLKCTNLKCRYFHLKWTKRYAEARRDHLYSIPSESEIHRDTRHTKPVEQFQENEDPQCQTYDDVHPTSNNDSFLLQQIRETNNTVQQLQSFIQSHLPLIQPQVNHHFQTQNLTEVQVDHPVPQYVQTPNQYPAQFNHNQYPHTQNQPSETVYPNQEHYLMNVNQERYIVNHNQYPPNINYATNAHQNQDELLTTHTDIPHSPQHW